MVDKHRRSQDLQISLPVIKRHYSSAVSPLLTPITASSTYSPVESDADRLKTPDQSTPFDSHQSFELELRFTEDNGEYICTFETPHSSPQDRGRNPGYWADPDEQAPMTPDRPPQGSKYHSYGSTSSSGSDTSIWTPFGEESNPYLACDSPTIPGAHMRFPTDQASPTRWSHVTPRSNKHPEPQFQWSQVSKESAKQHPRTSSDLLSPITIVLDTIQEHEISEMPSRGIRTVRKSLRRMESLPETESLPAIDLFQSVFRPGTSAKAPSWPLPAPPCSTPPQARLAPQPRSAMSGSQSKIQQLLGKTQTHKAECLQDSFVSLPFHYQANHPPRMQRMYDMI